MITYEEVLELSENWPEYKGPADPGWKDFVEYAKRFSLALRQYAREHGHSWQEEFTRRQVWS